jgi:hypothetical protein
MQQQILTSRHARKKDGPLGAQWQLHDKHAAFSLSANQPYDRYKNFVLATSTK